MAKNDRNSISLQLLLEDEEMYKQFSQAIDKIGDMFEDVAKGFEARMESSLGTVRLMANELEKISAQQVSPRRGQATDTSMQRDANAASRSTSELSSSINQMRLALVSARDGVNDLGQSYRSVDAIVDDLVTSADLLREASNDPAFAQSAKDVIRLRKEALTVSNQLVKKVSDLRRAEKISADRAIELLQRVGQASETLGDQRVRARIKALQVEKQANLEELRDFKRSIDARVALVRQYPKEYTAARQEVQAIVEEESRRLKVNKQNVDALERLKKAQAGLRRLDSDQSRLRKEATKQAIEDQKRLQIQEEARSEKRRFELIQFFETYEQQQKKTAKLDKGGLLGSLFGRRTNLRKNAKEAAKIVEGLRQDDLKAYQSALSFFQRQEESESRREKALQRQLAALRAQNASAEDIEDTERQLVAATRLRIKSLREVEDLTERVEAKTRSINERFSGSGRASSRARAKALGTFEGQFAAIQAGRLIQDAPFGLIGIINNVDQAVDAFVKLNAKTSSFGETLRTVFFGAGVASVGVWINVLLSSFLVLDRLFDITGKMAEVWDRVAVSIGLADREARAFKKTAKEAALESFDFGSLAPADLIEQYELLKEYREGLQEEFSVLSREVSGTAYPEYFSPEESKRMERLRGDLEKTKDVYEKLSGAVAESEGEIQGFNLATELGLSAANKLAQEAKEIALEQEIAILEIQERAGDDGIALKQRIERLKLKAEIEALRAREAAQREYARRAEATLSGSSAPFVAAADALKMQADLLEINTDRIVSASVTARKETDNAGKFLSTVIGAERRAARARLEAQQDTYEQRIALVDLAARQEIASLRESLDAFEGGEELKVRMARATASQITAIRQQAARDRDQIRKEETRAEVEAARDVVDLEAELLSARTAMIPRETDRQVREVRQAGAARVRALRRSIEDEVSLGEDRNQAMIDLWEDLIDAEKRLTERRVGEIRAQAAESVAAFREETMRMARQLAEEQMLLFAESSRGLLDSELDRQRRVLAMEEQFALQRLQADFNARQRELDQLQSQQQQSIETETYFYGLRLQLAQVFAQQYLAVFEGFQREVRGMEVEANIQLAQQVGSAFSQNLSSLTDYFDARERIFVERRRRELTQQGVAESEAREQAEAEAEERFKFQKRAAYAEAVVNSLNAGINIFNALSRFGNLPAAIAGAITAITFGLGQAAKIKAQSLSGGGGGGGAISLSGLSSSGGGGITRATNKAAPRLPDNLDKSYFTRLAPPSPGGSDAAAAEIVAMRKDLSKYASAIENRPSVATIPKSTTLDIQREIERDRSRTY